MDAFALSVRVSACVFLGANVFLAATAPRGAVDSVKATLTAARLAVLSERRHDEKLEALRKLARELVDTRAMGRRAIGDTLDQHPEEEQRDFLELFDELIVRSYLQKLLFFRNPKFGFGEREVSGDTVIVHTKILTQRDTFYVDYEMRQQGDRWKATDIVIEGISMTSNYASQFQSLLRSRSFENLLALMRRKVRGLRDPNAE